MTKRIISLILVVATLVLTLASCGFSYGKSDLSKYATLSGTFDTVLNDGATISIKLDDFNFGLDEGKRWEQVEEAIAKVLLATEKADGTPKYSATAESKPGKFDALTFCYFAETTEGEILFVKKMNGTSATSVDLGYTIQKAESSFTETEKFNKALSDAFLAWTAELGEFYETSSTLISIGDKVSVTYKDADGKLQEYKYVDVNAKSFNELKGAKVGDTVPTATVTTGTGDNEKSITYTDVKINSVLDTSNKKDSATTKANDVIFVTYTITIDVTKLGLAEGDTVDSIKMGDYTFNLDGNDTTGKNYVCKVTTEPMKLGESNANTFKGQLVGKSVGGVTIPDTTKIEETVSVVTKTGETKNEAVSKTVEVKYSGVNIDWIVNQGMDIDADNGYTGGFTFKYKPNITATADKTTTTGTTVTLDGSKELTYYVFPVSFVDVPEFEIATEAESGEFTSVTGLDAEYLVKNYLSTLLASELDEEAYAEHEHGSDEHDHYEFYNYFLACVAGDDYKNGDKTLRELLQELSEILQDPETGKGHTQNKSTLKSAISTLETKLKNYATASDAKKSEVATEVETARTSYENAKTAADESQAKVDAKIKEILECKPVKDTDPSLAEAICTDYTKQKYKELADGYKTAVDKQVFQAIIDLLIEKNYFVCDLNNLPTSAVDDAVKAKLNTYKNKFYSSATQSSSSTTTTDYKKYNGDFDAYLVATTNTEIKAEDSTKSITTLDQANAYIEEKARETVRDIMMIYVLADKYDRRLTEAEMEKYEDEYKAIEVQYAQLAAWGLSLTYTLDDYINAKQFDKVMDHFFEEYTIGEDNTVVYTNLKYVFQAEEEPKPEEGENK